MLTIWRFHLDSLIKLNGHCLDLISIQMNSWMTHYTLSILYSRYSPVRCMNIIRLFYQHLSLSSPLWGKLTVDSWSVCLFKSSIIQRRSWLHWWLAVVLTPSPEKTSGLRQLDSKINKQKTEMITLNTSNPSAIKVQEQTSVEMRSL